jgi:FAD/FMN-containing dehydrogenase
MSSGQVVINDVTQLNPIPVDRVVAPTAIEQIVAEVKAHPGPVSIGGGRFSMGGQTATEGALQIDMRRFDKVISLDTVRKEITVQAGITWSKIQQAIDPHNLSLLVMQSYANFTVGGALSVNAHGRYMGLGPAVLSVKSIRLVLANGDIVVASPEQNQELFYGAIGGYGALGVIAEATLQLADNVRMERHARAMPLSSYRDFFDNEIRGRKGIVFHNADIYPDSFDTVRAISYVETDKPPTVADRLIPHSDYRLQHWLQIVNSEWPGGKMLRQYIADPWMNRGEKVVWRNYEASYDVRELEPDSREQSTYVLQEFFVPVRNLDAFALKMAEILRRNRVNTINVSIRHANADPGTLLAWAREEVFAFVLYYKQGTSPKARRAVARWTRELIDAAIANQGAYYLPYQIWATKAQFHQAYPRANDFFAVKGKIDPANKFRNKLWDAYYHPEGFPVPVRTGNAKERLSALPDYKRDEAQTYLTLPEWYLVYNPAEYAQFIRTRVPSAFPYFASIGQFSSIYKEVTAVTGKKYSFNWGYHVMVFVIGASFTVENALKGAYENTIGRLSEWTAGGGRTDEDKFAADVAQHYADFIHAIPWYEFPFLEQMFRLWREVPLLGPSPLRKWERRTALSFEYLAKSQYAFLIRIASKLAYGEEDNEILALVENEAAASEHETKMVVIERFSDSSLVSLPRYDEFGSQVDRLVRQGVRFREIAGNHEIVLTAIVPLNWQPDLPVGKLILSQPVLSDADRKRVGLAVSVPALHTVLPALEQNGAKLEHLYDY